MAGSSNLERMAAQILPIAEQRRREADELGRKVSLYHRARIDAALDSLLKYTEGQQAKREARAAGEQGGGAAGGGAGTIIGGIIGGVVGGPPGAMAGAALGGAAGGAIGTYAKPPGTGAGPAQQAALTNLVSTAAGTFMANPFYTQNSPHEAGGGAGQPAPGSHGGSFESAPWGIPGGVSGSGGGGGGDGRFNWGGGGGQDSREDDRFTLFPRRSSVMT